MSTKICPLGDEHCAALNSVLQRVPQALEICDKCERAGLDMSEYRQQLEAQRDMATKLKQQFFPNHP